MSRKLICYFSASGVTGKAAKSLAEAAYDVIFAGFPVWWYTVPSIIRTFLEAYDFSGKVIVPFAASGGSGLGDTAKTLQELVPAAAVKDGKLLNGRLNTGELKKWADSFGN